MRKNSLLLAITAAILTACQTPSAPPDTASRVTLPANFDAAPDNPAKTDIAAWWREFHDPELNRLIARGLANSPTLTAAKTKLEAAEAQAKLADADRGLTLGLGVKGAAGTAALDNPLPDGARNLLNAAGSDLGSTHLDENAAGYQAGLAGSWAPDFFGKKQNTANAAHYAYLSEAEQAHGAQVLLTASIAQHYINARAYEAQAQLLAGKQQALANLLRYAKGRYQAAQATHLDMDELQSKISALQAQQGLLDTQRQNELAQIAALTGNTSLTLPKDGGRIFNHLPQPPSGEKPADILTRRPDLRARKAAIAARAAQRGAAAADFYPKFTIDFGLLNGRVALNGDLDGVKLGGSGGLISIGADLPIFTNGRLQANLAKADAELKNAAAEYDKTLLTALQEVNNSYRLAASLTAQTARLQTAANLAQQQEKNAKTLFAYNKVTFDKIPQAAIDAADMRLNLLENRKGRALNLIQLYTALGGGWQ